MDLKCWLAIKSNPMKSSYRRGRSTVLSCWSDTNSDLLRRDKIVFHCTSSSVFASDFLMFTQFTFDNSYAINYIHVKLCTFQRSFWVNMGLQMYSKYWRKYTSYFLFDCLFFPRSSDIKKTAYRCFPIKLQHFLASQHPRSQLVSNSPICEDSSSTKFSKDQKNIYVYILHIKISIPLHNSSVPFEVKEHQPLFVWVLLLAIVSELWGLSCITDTSHSFLLLDSRNSFQISCYFSFSPKKRNCNPEPIKCRYVCLLHSLVASCQNSNR